MRRLLGSVLLLLTTAVPASHRAASRQSRGRPARTTCRDCARRAGAHHLTSMRVPSPLVFDGMLDEPFYRDVPSFGDFIQQEPHEGQPATEKTEVWVFFDQRLPVRLGAAVGVRAWPPRGHRDAARRQQPLQQRSLRRRRSTASTTGATATALPSIRRAGMLDWSITNEQPNNNWNGIWDAQTRHVRQRLDGRDPLPVPLVPLPGGRPHLGHELPPQGALEERDVVPRAGARLVGPAGDVEDVRGGDAHRTRNAGQGTQHRHQALRARLDAHRQDGDAALHERSRRQRSAST